MASGGWGSVGDWPTPQQQQPQWQTAGNGGLIRASAYENSVADTESTVSTAVPSAPTAQITPAAATEAPSENSSSTFNNVFNKPTVNLYNPAAVNDMADKEAAPARKEAELQDPNKVHAVAHSSRWTDTEGNASLRRTTVFTPVLSKAADPAPEAPQNPTSSSSNSSTTSNLTPTQQYKLQEALAGLASKFAAAEQQAAAPAPVGSADGLDCVFDQSVIWATEQLTAAAKESSQLVQYAATESNSSSSSGSSSEACPASREIVNNLLSPGFDRPPCAASPSAAAAACLRALRDVALPVDVVVQVLVQCLGLVTAAEWRAGLAAALAATGHEVLQDSAADQSAGADKEEQQQQQAMMLQLLLPLVQHVQLQRNVNAEAPKIYAAILAAAAKEVHVKTYSTITKSYIGIIEEYNQELQVVLTPLVQSMLRSNSSSSSSSSTTTTTSGDSQVTGIDATAVPGAGLSAFAAVQMVLELSSNSSGSMGSMPAEEIDYVQLLMMSSVVPAMLVHYATAGSLALFVDCLSYQIREVASVLQRLYLLLLLQPHLSESDLQAAVAVTPLVCRSGIDPLEPAAAVEELHKLCNVLAPGKKIPLVNYAELLAAALQCTVRTPEVSRSRKTRHSGDQQPAERQLLLATVAVLGTFRGVREMAYDSLHKVYQNSSQVPLSDLAAVLCYSQMLLPAASASRLAAAVAASLNANQLKVVLALLKGKSDRGNELEQPGVRNMLHGAGRQDMLCTVENCYKGKVAARSPVHAMLARLVKYIAAFLYVAAYLIFACCLALAAGACAVIAVRVLS